MSGGLLLDTCALLWLAADPDMLSDPARRAIERAAGRLLVSAISAFEIGRKHVRRKLSLPQPVDEWFPAVLRQHGVRAVPVTARIAACAALLPPVHSDPADRMIIATAQLRQLVILTPDALIRAYPQATVVW